MPSNLDAIAALLLAIVPGFLASSAWARARTWKGHSGDLRTILQSLAGSLVVQVVASPLTIGWLFPHRHELERFPERIAAWLALVVLVLPVALGFGIAWLVHEARGRDLPVFRWREWPSAWDWMMTMCPPSDRFVMVEFKNGRKVAGYFAAGAQAITSPDRHGIYLSPQWQLDEDDEFVRPIPGSDGLLIPDLDEVLLVRVLMSEEITDGEEGEFRRQAQGRPEAC